MSLHFGMTYNGSPIGQNSDPTSIRKQGLLSSRSKKCMWWRQDWLSCKKCGETKDRSHFSDYMLKNRGDGTRVCLACQRPRDMWTFVACKNSQPKDAFAFWLETHKEKNRPNGWQRCNKCVQKAKLEEKMQSRRTLDQVQKSQ